MDGLVIKKNAVHALAMSAERFAVIRHHRHQRAVVQPALAQIGKELSQGGVGIRDLTVIGIFKLFIERNRRVIWGMRIVQMHPDKKWRCAVLTQPGDCVSDHISRTPFDGIVASLTGTAFLMKSGVEIVESAVKTGRHVGFGIQDERTDECGCVISALLQDFRYRRQKTRQRMSKICDGVKLGISAREDRRM